MPYFIIIGALFAMLSVALGAMGAHFLKNIIDPQALAIFKTASMYQMYHALALIVTGISISQSYKPKLLTIAGWLFIVGILLFSGSLYGLSILNIRALGMITPIGGLCFMLAWMFFAVSFYGKNKHPE